MKFLAKGKTERIIEDKDEKLSVLLKTFRHNLQNKYNSYTFIFFLCELLNFIVVVTQFIATDVFLKHQFIFYGLKVARYYNMPAEETNMQGYLNPMCEAFPRVASCTYWKYGSGGRQTGKHC